MEQELKLEFPDIGSLARFKQDAWFARLFPPGKQNRLPMHSYYFDTADDLLDQLKATVRLREEKNNYVLAIKASSQAITNEAGRQQGLFSRLEWEQKVTSGLLLRQDNRVYLDGSVVAGLFADFAATKQEQQYLDSILTLINSKSLVCVAEIVFNRLSAVIDLAGSQVETALDEGAYIIPGHSRDFYEFEAELLSGTAQPLLQLASCLRDSFNMRPAAGSKLARCLAFMREAGKLQR